MNELFRQGGWVLFAICGVSMVAWFLVAWKTLELLWEAWWGFNWARDAVETLRAGNETGALEICKAHPGIVGRAMLYGMDSVGEGANFDRHYKPFLDAESMKLHNHLPLIGTLASVLPLLGLLGTVMGMVVTFDAIVKYGGGNPESLADGISQALITTKAGLVTALPVYLLHGWLVSRADRCVEAATMFAKMVHSIRKKREAVHV